MAGGLTVKMSGGPGDSVWQATKCEAVSGIGAGVISDIVFYALDSHKVLRQNNQRGSFLSLFRGILPVLTLGSAPSFGIFFVAYYPTKVHLTRVTGNDHVAVVGASVVAGVPSSLLGVPSDVLKKRIVLRGEAPWPAMRALVRDGHLMLGWRANLTKDVAFAAIKMTLYESCSRAWLVWGRPIVQSDVTSPPLTWASSSSPAAPRLTPIEAGGVGFASGTLTAVLTCPIDVVNTRIKAGQTAITGMLAMGRHVTATEGVRALFKGLGVRIGIISFGSTWFWTLFEQFQALQGVASTDRK